MQSPPIILKSSSLLSSPPSSPPPVRDENSAIANMDQSASNRAVAPESNGDAARQSTMSEMRAFVQRKRPLDDLKLPTPKQIRPAALGADKGCPSGLATPGSSSTRHSTKIFSISDEGGYSPCSPPRPAVSTPSMQIRRLSKSAPA